MIWSSHTFINSTHDTWVQYFISSFDEFHTSSHMFKFNAWFDVFIIYVQEFNTRISILHLMSSIHELNTSSHTFMSSMHDIHLKNWFVHHICSWVQHRSLILPHDFKISTWFQEFIYSFIFSIFLLKLIQLFCIHILFLLNVLISKVKLFFSIHIINLIHLRWDIYNVSVDQFFHLIWSS